MSAHTKVHTHEKTERKLLEAPDATSVEMVDVGMAARRFFRYLGLTLILFTMGACASVISERTRNEASIDLTLREVSRAPDNYQGKTVIWSGSILEAQNTREGTLLTILQKPADYQGKPKKVDESEGRFLALARRYLDPAIFASGRSVTVAGEIEGKRVKPLGEIEYVYPFLSVKEIHLWPTETREMYDYYYPPYYWYGPSWWWRHW